jgi:hypothetical protein
MSTVKISSSRNFNNFSQQICSSCFEIWINDDVDLFFEVQK